MILVKDLVLVGGNGHESGSEANGQVVGVHHVLVTELRETVVGVDG